MASVCGWRPSLLSPVTVVTAGTKVQLSATAILSCNVFLQADPTNTNKVYVGDSTVSSTTGIGLSPGATISLETFLVRGCMEDVDLSDIWLDADTNGNKVRCFYMRRK